MNVKSAAICSRRLIRALADKDPVKAAIARESFEAFITPLIDTIFDHFPIHVNPNDPFGPFIPLR